MMTNVHYMPSLNLFLTSKKKIAIDETKKSTGGKRNLLLIFRVDWKDAGHQCISTKQFFVNHFCVSTLAILYTMAWNTNVCPRQFCFEESRKFLRRRLSLMLHAKNVFVHIWDENRFKPLKSHIRFCLTGALSEPKIVHVWTAYG